MPEFKAISKIPVPFTVVGGFLGSGITTLLNHLLKMSSGVRFAILVNDFGDLNIDASLIASHEGETISLTNGCICCNMVDGFVETMIKLMKRIDEFDQIVIEASGVSEPDRIMDIARLDPELIPNGIIIMIDGVNIRNQIENPYVGKIVLEQMKATKIQSKFRGNKSRLESKSKGYLRREDKERDWIHLKRQMQASGFKPEQIERFHRDHYMASKKKKKSKRRHSSKKKKKSKGKKRKSKP